MKLKVPVLPIHDSYVVRHKDKQWINWMMKSVYRQFIPGHSPVVETVAKSTLPGTHKKDRNSGLVPSIGQGLRSYRT